MKLSDIHLNPCNPRIIKGDRFKKLVKSIEEFPKMMVLRPIIVDAEGMILGGNMRYKALKELKYKEVPDEWVKRADELTDEEKQRFIIEDNVPFGEWDFDILANEWDVDQLAEWGLEIPDFAVNKEVAEDDYEIPDEIKTDIVLGDLFEIGQHRLLCGDSTDSDQVAKLMNGQKADMVFTDPPYGINAVHVKKDTGGGGKLGFTGGGGIVNATAYIPIKNDDSTKTAEEFYHVCLSLGMDNFIIWGGNYFTQFLPPSRCWYIWDKKEQDMDSTFADCEIAWVSKDGNSKIYRHLWAGLLRKGERDIELTKRIHPTQKPVTLFINILKDNDFKLCFDGFLGSGSTMVAAHKLNKPCYGIEYEPIWCQVIIDRMRKLDPGLVIKRNGKTEG